jgi:hypothetical protein
MIHASPLRPLLQSASFIGGCVRKLIPVLLFVTTASSAYAAPVKVDIAFDLTHKYDYATQQSVVPDDLSGIVTLTWNTANPHAFDDGRTTTTFFEGPTFFSSPITQLVSPNPFGGGSEEESGLAWPNVTDSENTFVEEFAAQSGAYHESGDKWWGHQIEVRATKVSAPRSGDGRSDYAFTGAGAIDLLREFQTGGWNVSFTESYQLFDGRSSQGFMWQAETARIIHVLVGDEDIPEPASFGILAAGLLTLGMYHRVRDKRPARLALT